MLDWVASQSALSRAEHEAFDMLVHFAPDYTLLLST
jgi:hypothetical protein